MHEVKKYCSLGVMMEIKILYAEHGDLDQLADLLAERFMPENDSHLDRE